MISIYDKLYQIVEKYKDHEKTYAYILGYPLHILENGIAVGYHGGQILWRKDGMCELQIDSDYIHTKVSADLIDAFSPITVKIGKRKPARSSPAKPTINGFFYEKGMLITEDGKLLTEDGKEMSPVEKLAPKTLSEAEKDLQKKINSWRRAIVLASKISYQSDKPVGNMDKAPYWQLSWERRYKCIEELRDKLSPSTVYEMIMNNDISEPTMMLIDTYYSWLSNSEKTGMRAAVDYVLKDHREELFELHEEQFQAKIAA